MFVSIFSTTTVWNIFNSRRNWARYDQKCIQYIGLHMKYPLFLSDFNEIWIFWTDFRKILKSNFMKIRPVGAELLHADRRTDMTKLIVAFRNFVNARIHVRVLMIKHFLFIVLLKTF
jgi:hypothetical protein